MPSPSDEQRTASWVGSFGSNKPVLPTATNQPDDNPLNSLRRQTGRPLGRRAATEATPDVPETQD